MYGNTTGFQLFLPTLVLSIASGPIDGSVQLVAISINISLDCVPMDDNKNTLLIF